jgi:nucleoside-diphosphate-sugar epimerase
MDLAASTIAVTGATGFFGHYIAEELIARGARVIGVVRNPSRGPDLAAKGVEFRVADLRDRESLTQAFEGVDAIVANAGATPQRTGSNYYEMNTSGAENVFRGAQQAGVRRVVQVSSVAVYRRVLRNVSEDGEFAPRRVRVLPAGGYRLSKALAESLAGRIGEEANLQMTIVRPGQMFGVRDIFLSRLRWFLGGRVTVLPLGFWIQLLYARDAAWAITQTLSDEHAIGKVYNLTGPQVSFPEIVQAWRRAGGQVAFLSIPIPFPFKFCWSSECAIRELGWTFTPLVEAFQEVFAEEAEGQRRIS